MITPDHRMHFFLETLLPRSIPVLANWAKQGLGLGLSEAQMLGTRAAVQSIRFFAGTIDRKSGMITPV